MAGQSSRAAQPNPAVGTAPRRIQATAQIYARRVVDRLPFAVHVHRRMWFHVLDLAAVRESPLPEGLALAKATHDDLGALRATEAYFDKAPEFLEAGHDLWLTRTDDGQVIHSSWIFRGKAPSDAARHGWFVLPDGMVNLEDTVVHGDHRGHGLIGAVTGALARSLLAEGQDRLLTITLESNMASRRAAAKIGCHAFALVDVRKSGYVPRKETWRDRVDDESPLMCTRLSVEAATDDDPARTRAAERLARWLEGSLHTGAAGPR